MIVLNLCCRQDHRFEGWFASADAFDAQSARGLVSCPICEDREVSRLPSGPHVRRVTTEVQGPAKPAAPEFRALVDAVMSSIAEADDVGSRFPEEARRIHYEEIEPRSIRGQASVREAVELLDEGILVMPVPEPDKKH